MMQRKTEPSVVRDPRLIELLTEIVTEVRDHAVQMDAMIGLAAAPSQMRTKQIDERPSPTARRTTERAALLMVYFLLVAEQIDLTAIESVTAT